MVVVFDQKKKFFFAAVNFFQFLVIKTLESDQMNADPQPWL